MKLRTPSVTLATSLRSLGLLALLGLFTLPSAAEITVTGDFSPDEPFWSNGGDPNTEGTLFPGSSLSIQDNSSLEIDTLDTHFGTSDIAVTINSGGKLIATDQIRMGLGINNKVNVMLSDPGSEIRTGGNLAIGHLGLGDLTISNQAVANVTARAIISFNSGSSPDSGFGNLILDQGTLNAGTLFARPQNLLGQGTLNIGGLARDGWDDVVIDFNGSNVFQTKLTENGKDIDLTITADGRGVMEVKRILLRNGAQVEHEEVTIGSAAEADDALSVARVTDPGTVWSIGKNGGSTPLNVGFFTPGQLTIEKGAHVNANSASIGRGDRGVVTVKGANSRFNMTEGSLIIGSTGQGTLNVADGGQVNVTDDIRMKLSDPASGSANLYVSGNGMLNAGTDGTGDLENNGIVRLFAGQGLAVGTYSPITVGADEGDFTGSGTYEAFGGIWNDAAHTFTVGSLLDGSGGIVDEDLTGQRYEFSFGGNPEALLTASFGAGAGIADFSVLQLDLGSISGASTLAVFDFTTNLADGTNVLLSYFVGANVDEDAIAFWHSEDGLAWTVYTPDTWVYADGWVSFLVDGFSGYAVTVPEPASGSLLLGAGAVWLLRRRKHRGNL